MGGSGDRISHVTAGPLTRGGADRTRFTARTRRGRGPRSWRGEGRRRRGRGGGRAVSDGTVLGQADAKGEIDRRGRDRPAWAARAGSRHPVAETLGDGHGAARSVSGRRTRNSSPPSRATRSPYRNDPEQHPRRGLQREVAGRGGPGCRSRR